MRKMREIEIVKRLYDIRKFLIFKDEKHNPYAYVKMYQTKHTTHFISPKIELFACKKISVVYETYDILNASYCLISIKGIKIDWIEKMTEVTKSLFLIFASTPNFRRNSNNGIFPMWAATATVVSPYLF